MPQFLQAPGKRHANAKTLASIKQAAAVARANVAKLDLRPEAAGPGWKPGNLPEYRTFNWDGPPTYSNTCGTGPGRGRKPLTEEQVARYKKIRQEKRARDGPRKRPWLPTTLAGRAAAKKATPARRQAQKEALILAAAQKPVLSHPPTRVHQPFLSATTASLATQRNASLPSSLVLIPQCGSGARRHPRGQTNPSTSANTRTGLVSNAPR